MSNVVRAVYFAGLNSPFITPERLFSQTGHKTKEDLRVKNGDKVFYSVYEFQFNRFERLFLSAIVPGDYYFFIIANEQLPLFNDHIKEFGMGKYEKYRSKVPIANTRYSEDPRLNVFIYQFDSEFADKWKEWSSK